MKIGTAIVVRLGSGLCSETKLNTESDFQPGIKLGSTLSTMVSNLQLFVLKPHFDYEST